MRSAENLAKLITSLIGLGTKPSADADAPQNASTPVMALLVLLVGLPAVANVAFGILEQRPDAILDVAVGAIAVLSIHAVWELKRWGAIGIILASLALLLFTLDGFAHASTLQLGVVLRLLPIACVVAIWPRLR